jgi:DNA-binding transcriptional LysR family regulator
LAPDGRRKFQQWRRATIQITATDYVADTILWPKLAKFLPQYPDIKVEITVDYGLDRHRCPTL